MKLKILNDRKRLKSHKIDTSKDYPIDFVVLWVDGNDQEWIKKKNNYRKTIDNSSSNNRYREWGVFKYWFRAVSEYAPWVNHIYVVTDSQKPNWLNLDSNKVTVVDHKEIIDKDYLPTFNSQAIEMNIYKIKGLSEHFVYFNDDMYIVSPVDKKDFFKNGLPLHVANINPGTGILGDQLYAKALFNNTILVNRHFDQRKVVFSHPLKWINPKYGKYNLKTITQIPFPYFTGFKPLHAPMPLLKSTFVDIWDKEYAALSETSSHKFRHPEDLNQDVFTQWQICSNNFYPQSVKKYMYVSLSRQESIPKIDKAIKSKKVKFLCINDTFGDEEDVEKLLMTGNALTDIFENKLGTKSEFEK